MIIFPPLVTKLTQLHNAWIVGSAADPNKNLSTVRDWDILVPWSEWSKAVLLIPTTATPNTFGGWKCLEKGIIIDVWPDDIATLLNNSMTKFVYHPRSGNRWKLIQ